MVFRRIGFALPVVVALACVSGAAQAQGYPASPTAPRGQGYNQPYYDQYGRPYAHQPYGAPYFAEPPAGAEYPNYAVTPALRPNRDAVWVPGYWKWENGRYLWVGGHWDTVSDGFSYVHPHYDYVDGQWRLIRGYWSKR
jgi:hypothetical protein